MSSILPPLSFLVDLRWLQKHIEDADLLCIDARPADEYAKGRLRGAINVDTYRWGWYDTSPAGLRAYIAKMTAIMAEVGLWRGRPVLFYQGTSGMVAARGVWLLHYLGHREVAILDGGLRAWVAAGGEVITQSSGSAAAPEAATDQPMPDNSCLASYEYVFDHLDDPDTVILDVRAEDEYLGENVRASRGGHIPGAVRIEWAENLGPDKRFLPVNQLRQLYESRGVTPEKEVITYCQGGARSSHSYLALRLLGYPRLRNFIGSWREWADRHELPIVTPAVGK